MIMSRLFATSTLNTLKVGIEGTNQRHQAISNNIANVDTPNYQRATVSFEDQLRRTLNRTDFRGHRNHPAHFVIGGPEEVGMVRPRVDIDNETRFRADRNNVNIDEEMASLAQNTNRNIQYTEFIKRSYQGLKSVIRTAGGE